MEHFPTPPRDFAMETVYKESLENARTNTDTYILAKDVYTNMDPKDAPRVDQDTTIEVYLIGQPNKA